MTGYKNDTQNIMDEMRKPTLGSKTIRDAMGFELQVADTEELNGFRTGETLAGKDIDGNEVEFKIIGFSVDQTGIFLMGRRQPILFAEIESGKYKRTDK